MIDALVLGAGAVGLWVAGHRLDIFESIVAFIESHEAWELDELVVAFIALGLAGFIYSARRLSDLRHEYGRRMRAEADAKWSACHDALTGLPNRRFLEERFRELSEPPNRRPFALLLIDLNGFKRINDLRGHDVGDRLLETVAERLVETIPNGTVARYGGDEFMALLPGKNRDQAAEVADAVLKAFAVPAYIDGHPYRVGTAIGIAGYPCHTDNVDDLVRLADIAMYRAKTTLGDGAIVFNSSFLTELHRTEEGEKALAEAMRRGRIRPHYQPLIDLSDGRVIGCEALARWERDDGSFVPPGEFIPLAESMGVIDGLSYDLFRQACRDVVSWDAPLFLSFNLSAVQFEDPSLGLNILAILNETGLPPARLELEITESVFVHNEATTLAVIEQLQALGIRIALDDFGTGYSSLSRLANLSIDRVKIDHSFVGRCLEDVRSMSVVKAIISLSRTLGLSVTAEGIETQPQYARLKKIGCNVGQGFLFGKALPAADFHRLLQDANAGPLLASRRA
ncbi:putative bifunctional diguanylate cyclase/phosphodiesterase [Rhodobium gokarnense]|uniref:Diguanylate cyclase (GGDEF)-like protein n=1 Tax=Rhodobium gokarnense TaxID=364296 RepID=A0ABT3HC44_9HYPH|nr:EAL domain-containing protein [Rhodobium gokarnense]MCW2307963.1 diguanylate cyclase (GGDEF)-like protein [Rhodobium gokarnense]